MLSVGQKAPDISVQAHSGESFQLSDHIDTTVVLWFYPKANTGG